MIKPLIVCVAVGGLALAACSASKTDFQKKAAEVLVNELHKTDPKATAQCENPPSAKVGTKFSCTATSGDGTKVDATAEITKKDFVVVSIGTAGAAAGPGGSDPADVADLLLSQADAEGYDVDRSCALGLANQLSVEDRTKILADPQGSPTLSAAGDAISAKTVTCIRFTDRTRQSLAKTVADSLGSSDATVVSCVDGVFSKLDDAELLAVLQSSISSDPPAEVKTALEACVPA